MNPYFVLGVPLEADDGQIRKAYLEAVKQARPEEDPGRLQSLTHAYETIRDEEHRLRYRLFPAENNSTSPIDVFLQHMRWTGCAEPLDWASLQEFLHRCQRPNP